MINQQSEAKSTSSTKQHKRICQLRTNTTACTSPANDYSNGVRDQSNNKAPSILLFFGGVSWTEEHNKKRMRYRDECMSFTGFFRGYCLLTTTFAWRSLTTGRTIIFLLVFCVDNVFPVFCCTSLHAIKCVTDKKHVV